MALLQGEHVLVVGGDSPSQRSLITALGLEGAEVQCASTGQAALLASNANVLVTDVTLPDQSGASLLSQLRARRAEQDGPLIAIGLLEPADQAAPDQPAFQKRLARPFSALDVVLAIVSCVKARRETRPSAAPLPGAGFSLLPHLTKRVEQKDMRGTLALLNSTTVFRYTSIFRFDEERLTSVWTFDRKLPEADQFPLDATVSSSYCSFIRDSGAPMLVSDANTDPRVADHPKRLELKSYCGVPLRRADGSLYGSLCHFDLEPRLIANETVQWLEEGARLLTAGLDSTISATRFPVDKK